jgi:hypothetical protein
VRIFCNEDFDWNAVKCADTRSRSWCGHAGFATRTDDQKLSMRCNNQPRFPCSFAIHTTKLELRMSILRLAAMFALSAKHHSRFQDASISVCAATTYVPIDDVDYCCQQPNHLASAEIYLRDSPRALAIKNCH